MEINGRAQAVLRGIACAVMVSGHSSSNSEYPQETNMATLVNITETMLALSMSKSSFIPHVTTYML